VLFAELFIAWAWKRGIPGLIYPFSRKMRKPKKFGNLGNSVRNRLYANWRTHYVPSPKSTGFSLV